MREALGDEHGAIVTQQVGELLRGREATVRHVVGRDAIQQRRETGLALLGGLLEVDELRQRAREQVLVLEPRDVHPGRDPAVTLPVNTDESVALLEVGAVEGPRRARARPELSAATVFGRCRRPGSVKVST
ncbi:MAG: hypothetical protein M5U27_13965 [Gaiella sp.]|nr:hypothetical protein [Gaiella sp.]